MTNSKLVHVGPTSVTPTLTNPGPHIILSVEDYNKIVRQLNILREIASDILPPRDGRLHALSRQAMEPINE